MSESEVVRQESEFAALVGIDWADQKHAWCVQAAGTTQRESGEVEHTPEAVEAWIGQLCQRFGNRPIAVAVEQVKGALVFMLSKYEPLHLFPVPPAMAANLRKALYPSGVKDDPRDADLLVDLLLQHRDKLRRLSPDSEATRRVWHPCPGRSRPSSSRGRHWTQASLCSFAARGARSPSISGDRLGRRRVARSAAMALRSEGQFCDA